MNSSARLSAVRLSAARQSPGRPGPVRLDAARLDAARRERELDEATDGRVVDLLVVGLGVTGAGVALDAAARGLDVVAVDAHDLAFGTSRWSSKLVHGGLRYLAHGQVGVARESAVERGILMGSTAPHLTHALPMLVPLTPRVSPKQAAMVRSALAAGDLLRAAAHTPRSTLPPSRRIGARQTRALAPEVAAGVRGGLLSWDGQLEDDARLVVALARTAAAHGARILGRTRVLTATGDGAEIRDELTGSTATIRARAVVNAAGVWAGELEPGVRLRPSRGSHLVLRRDALPGLSVAVTAPAPGELNRFVLVLPQPDGRIYVGPTDVPVDGSLPDVAVPSEAEVDFLLEVVGSVFDHRIGRGDVVGTFAGLRPLLEAAGRTADLSRRHAVHVSADGVVTVVGGKLTTYRRMAEDAVDAAMRRRRLVAGPCTTRRLPLVGAAPRNVLRRLAAPASLVRRYGVEAPDVLAVARAALGGGDAAALGPVTADGSVTLADLIWGASHEGAQDMDDLLDRRTRIGLVPAERVAAEPAARRALDLAGEARLG